MAHDPDNFRTSAFVIQDYVLADGIAIGKIFFRENIVHHDHVRRVLSILCREKTSALQGNAHHLEIVFFHDIAERPTLLVVGLRLRLPFNPEKILVVAAERHGSPREGDGLHSWNRGELPVHVAKSRANLGGAGVTHGRRESHAKSEHVVRVKPRVDVPERREAPQHEPR